MKNFIKKIALVIVLITLLNLYIVNVSAELGIINPGTAGLGVDQALQYVGDTEYPWYEGYAGVKINIVPAGDDADQYVERYILNDYNDDGSDDGMHFFAAYFNSIFADTTMFVPENKRTKRYISGEYLDNPKNPYYWRQVPSGYENLNKYYNYSTYTQITGQGLPIEWPGSQDFSLDGWLKKDNFTNLRLIINEAFYGSELKKMYSLIDKGIDLYILVEPMLVIGKFYGTPYELSHLFCNGNKNECPTSLVDLQGITLWDRFYDTIYMEKRNIGNLGYNLAYYAGSRNTTIKMDGIFSKTVGAGLGVYKFDEVFETHTCEKIGDKYYGKDGGEVKYEQYRNECLNTPPPQIYSCKIVNGIYYKKNGSITTSKTEYETDCETADLKIYKRNSVNSSLITSATTTFRLYKGIGCTGNFVAEEDTISGVVTFSGLTQGVYSLEEYKYPNGYNKPSNSCVLNQIDVTVGINTRTVYNTPSCSQELSNSNKTKSELFALYDKYGYNGLLNFNNPSCSSVSCNHSTDFSCLSANFERWTTFNSNNISCYNEKFDFNGSEVYCLNTFELNNRLGTTNWSVKSGQMIIQSLNNITAATGTVTRKCYFRGSSIGFDPGTYSKYVSYVEFNNKNLPASNTSQTLSESYSNGSYHEYSASVNYNLNPVYSEVVTGNVNSSGGMNYKILGYGIVSEWKATSRYEIPFAVGLKSDFGGTYKNNRWVYSASNQNRCWVDPIPELITPPSNRNNPYKLNLEIRIIDTSNPFPGKTGTNTRTVGTNWRSQSVSSYNNTLRNRIESNISNLVFDKNLLSMYDLNKDGKINDEDLEFFDWRASNYNNNEIMSKSNNSYIAYIMSTTNNSYNKNKTEPKYKITLTPSTVKEIREYNKNNTYDNKTLRCNSGEDCISTFLSDLKNGKVNGKTGYDKLIIS